MELEEACFPEPRLTLHSLCGDWPGCPPLPAPRPPDCELAWQPSLLAPPSAPRCLPQGSSFPQPGGAQSLNLAPTLCPSRVPRARGHRGPDCMPDAAPPRSWPVDRGPRREKAHFITLFQRRQNNLFRGHCARGPAARWRRVPLGGSERLRELTPGKLRVWSARRLPTMAGV